MKLKKGDRVMVLSGKDRGKDGVIMKVLPGADKVIVEGRNVAKKHQKATRATMQGGIIDKDMPLAAAAVALISPGVGNPSRVAYRFVVHGNKVRICARTKVDL